MIVDLADVVASGGKIVRPTKIVLDIDYWKGGSYNDPALDIDVTTYGVDAASPEEAMTQQSVSTTSWSNSSGFAPLGRRVAVALPQGNFGSRFRVRLTTDNIAYDSVQVYYDEQEDPR